MMLFSDAVFFAGRKYRVCQAAADKPICSYQGSCGVHRLFILGML